MNEFDHWLEDELGSALGSITPSSPGDVPAYRAARGRRRLSLASALPVALGTKFAAGIAVAALAAGGTATVVVSNHLARAGAGQAASAALVEAFEHDGGTLSGDDLSSGSAATRSDESGSSTEADSSATNHGAAVTSAVSSCKASSSKAEASETSASSSSSKSSGDEHGIGQCVANVASDPRADRTTTTSSTSTSESRGESDNHPTPPPHP